MPSKGTYFFHADGTPLGSDSELLPLPLFKGMLITIEGHEGEFEVVDWKYHHGHPDDKAGLWIHLLPSTKPPGAWSITEFRV
jgi:hypothetical protein